MNCPRVCRSCSSPPVLSFRLLFFICPWVETPWNCLPCSWSFPLAENIPSPKCSAHSGGLDHAVPVGWHLAVISTRRRQESKMQKCEMICPRPHPKVMAIKGPESRFLQLMAERSMFYHTREEVVLVVFLDH